MVLGWSTPRLLHRSSLRPRRRCVQIHLTVPARSVAGHDQWSVSPACVTTKTTFQITPSGCVSRRANIVQDAPAAACSSCSGAAVVSLRDGKRSNNQQAAVSTQSGDAPPPPVAAARCCCRRTCLLPAPPVSHHGLQSCVAAAIRRCDPLGHALGRFDVDGRTCSNVDDAACSSAATGRRRPSPPPVAVVGGSAHLPAPPAAAASHRRGGPTRQGGAEPSGLEVLLMSCDQGSRSRSF